MGYGGSLSDAGMVTKYSHDDGIDGIIKEDKLGLDKIYIQAKRYNTTNTIGKPQIQQFVGALDEQKQVKVYSLQQVLIVQKLESMLKKKQVRK